MGLQFQQVMEITKFVKDHHINSVCMIGKQDILMSREDFMIAASDFNFNLNTDYKSMDAFDFFHMIGVEKVSALDISDYEGCDIIFDLNSEMPPEQYIGKFDFVIDGGTLEHVFNQYNAINNINALVAERGYVYHMLPCAGFIDHGFYSFSPTYFRDVYAKKNGWDLCELNFFIKETDDFSSAGSISQDCRLFRTIWEEEKYVRKYLQFAAVQIRCIAQKICDVNKKISPAQGIYNNRVIDFDQVLKLKDKGSFVLYGSGNYANQIMNIIYKNNMEDMVPFIFDSDINKAGSSFRGKEVKYPNIVNLEKFVGKILICSVIYEKQIYEFLISQGVDAGNIICFSDLNRDY